jgi:hypothetical protein
MRRAKLPEKVAPAVSLLAASLLMPACASDHHVSPWGGRPGPSLTPFVVLPGLAPRIAEVDAEAAALRLVMTAEIPLSLSRGGAPHPAVLRGYAGQDAAGRPVHAVRVATELGVVMALGPLGALDLDRSPPTELVEQAGVLRSGLDLNGDGTVDVVARNEAGVLSVFHVDELGSGEYAVSMAAPPTAGVLLDGDPHPALWGHLPVPADDPIAPKLDCVAAFEGGRYTGAAPAARAWHAAKTAALEAAAPPPKDRDDLRLRAALEHAWHALLAAGDPEAVQQALGQQAVPPALRASFDRHARAVATLTASASPRPAPPAPPAPPRPPANGPSH